MIIINVQGDSVKRLKVLYYQAAGSWCGICPECKSVYQHYGTYPRKTPAPFGPAFIKRVYCKNCKKTHALLPCFIIPYSRVMNEVRQAAIAGISYGSHTIEQLAELTGVEPTTIARWWKIFCQKSGAMMKALSQKLAQSSQLINWLSGPLGTWHEKARKILELMGRCRATFFLDFQYGDFSWVNLFNPNLLFHRKGITDRTPGAVSTG